MEDVTTLFRLIPATTALIDMEWAPSGKANLSGEEKRSQERAKDAALNAFYAEVQDLPVPAIPRAAAPVVEASGGVFREHYLKRMAGINRSWAERQHAANVAKQSSLIEEGLTGADVDQKPKRARKRKPEGASSGN